MPETNEVIVESKKKKEKPSSSSVIEETSPKKKRKRRKSHKHYSSLPKDALRTTNSQPSITRDKELSESEEEIKRVKKKRSSSTKRDRSLTLTMESESPQIKPKRRHLALSNSYRRSAELQYHSSTGKYQIKDQSPREFEGSNIKKEKFTDMKLSKLLGKVHQIGGGSKKSKSIEVFGACIADLVHDPQNTNEIPIIIRQCVDYLVTRDAHLLEGIFRKSGSHDMLLKLKKSYNSPSAEVDLSICEDPHCVASLLKQFLLAMSEPIIPFRDYEQVVQNYNYYKEENEKIGVIKNLLSTLPAANRSVLVYLMRFLTRVSHNSESNLMNSESLGIVFGPTILRPLVEDQKTLTDRTNTMVVTRMIEYYDEVFQR